MLVQGSFARTNQGLQRLQARSYPWQFSKIWKAEPSQQFLLPPQVNPSLYASYLSISYINIYAIDILGCFNMGNKYQRSSYIFALNELNTKFKSFGAI